MAIPPFYLYFQIPQFWQFSFLTVLKCVRIIWMISQMISEICRELVTCSTLKVVFFSSATGKYERFVSKL